MSKMIPKEIVEQVRQASDIVEIIQSYVPLKRAGSTYKALSPFQKEKTPSFTVSPQLQIFKCYSSGHGGDVFKFVQLYEQADFPTAVRRLAERAGIPIPEEVDERDGGASRQLHAALIDLHNAVAGWWSQQLHKAPEAEPARAYLSSRKIGTDLAREWGLGYSADSWDATLHFAKARGYKEEVLAASGLFVVSEKTAQLYDRFRGRLMFPICNDSGQVIAFSGRVLAPDAKGAKYINSGLSPLFVKGRVLFGLHKTKRAIIDSGTAILCEGQLDLIRCWEYGIRNVVAPQGTAFTATHGQILKRFASEVIICFDSDRAGQQASERSVEVLLESDLTVRIAKLPSGEDPDSLLRTQGKEAMETILANAQDFIDHLLEVTCQEHDIATPRGQAAATDRMRSVVRRIENPLVRIGIEHRIASRLRLPFAAVNAEIQKGQPLRSRFGDLSAKKEEGEAMAAHVAKAEVVRCSAQIAALLSLLLPRPELVPVVQRDLRIEWLEGLEGAALLQDLLTAHAEESFEEAQHYISQCPENEQNFLLGLLVNPLPLPEEMKLDRYAVALVQGCEDHHLAMRKQLLHQEIKSGNCTPQELSAKLEELTEIGKKPPRSLKLDGI